MSGPRTYLAAAGGCAEVREAPAILQRDGTTFLVYSTCDTGKPDYQLWMKTIAMTADPLVAGNWHQHPAAMFTRDDAAGAWGPGSNGFFTSPDGSERWLVYHAKNTSQYTYDFRTTRAQRITWVDGMPVLGTPAAAGATHELPAGDPGRGAYVIDDGGSASGPVRAGGTLSGPALMTLADRAAYYLTLALVGPVIGAVTANLAIHFLVRPEPADITATATMLRLGKRLAVSAVDLHVADQLVAHATVTYALPTS